MKTLNPIHFIAILFFVCLLPASTGICFDKPPFKVLYSNDVTHIVTCVSPYHKKGDGFTKEMIEASVLETAHTGVDVHMLQPGLGWIPWWRSKVYPADEHYRRYVQKTGLEPDPFGRYMLDGGDMVQVFMDVCKRVNLKPFISLRLNDGHHLENTGMNNPGSIWVSRFYEEHPEYRIGPEIRSWDEHVHNWAIPEVRAHKFAFIREICENYEIAGLELDFMRHSSYFQLDKTTSKERVEIMSAFVLEVRKLLDRTTRSGQHRWLCVRVPCHLAAHDRLGIDLQKFVQHGVEMVNLSPHFFTEQQTDLAKIQKLVPNAALYLELTHCTLKGNLVNKSGGDNFTFCRTTDEQLYTAGHLAYARGADGISTFNFVYYREHGAPGRGPFNEPPFHVLKCFSDPDLLACQPQDYFLASTDNVPPIPNRQMPVTLKPGEKKDVFLDMAPPAGGWNGTGKLRIQGAGPLEKGEWKVRLNGAELTPEKSMPQAYPCPYAPCPPTEKHLLAWQVPAKLLIDGENKIEIERVAGSMSLSTNFPRGSSTLCFIGLFIK